MEEIMRLEIGHQSDVCMVGSAKSSQCDNKILDNESIWDGSQVQLHVQALTIQRAWRNYRGKNNTEQNANDPSSCETNGKLDIQKDLCLSGSVSEVDFSEAESGNQDMSVSSPDECERNFHDTDDDSHADPVSSESRLLPSYKSLSETATSDGDDDPDVDSYSESVSSDSSDSNDPLELAPEKEYLSPLHIYEENDLQNDNVIHKATLPGKNLDETSDELVKQMRKHNYLTMAQEFASLKKINPNALPFNMHKSRREPLMSDDIPPFNFSHVEENNQSSLALSDDCHSGIVPKSDDERSEISDNLLNTERDNKGFTTLDIMPKTDVPDILKVDGVTLNNSWNDKNKYIWDKNEKKITNNLELSSTEIKLSLNDDEKKVLNVPFSEIKDCIYEPPEVKCSASVCNIYTDDAKNLDCNKSKKDCVKNEVDLPANMTASHAAKHLANSKKMDFSNKYPANMVHKDHCMKPVANSSARFNNERSNSAHKGKSSMAVSHGNKPPANARSHGSAYHRGKLGANREPLSHRRETKLSSPEFFGEFDVYNIETAMPTIDWVAMEEHLAKAAKEEELLRRDSGYVLGLYKLCFDQDISDGDEQIMWTSSTSSQVARKERTEEEITALISWYREKYGNKEKFEIPGLRIILPEDEEETSDNKWNISSILQRRNDREEIRRRLATGSDSDEYYGGERIMRKPSLQTRLQSGMNLQICFMNETAGEHENSTTEQDSQTNVRNSNSAPPVIDSSVPAKVLTKSSLNAPAAANAVVTCQNEEEMDFVTRQAKLQAEARLALAQAKEMAHMQMEVEKQRKKKSPITEMVGITFPDGQKRANHQVLNEMNVAQLQVIVNDLHTQIENLNEELVRLLLERDDLHMEQDSMLVDIEDLTRYLGAKDRALKENQGKRDPKQPLSSKTASFRSSKPLTPKLMLKLKK